VGKEVHLMNGTDMGAVKEIMMQEEQIIINHHIKEIMIDLIQIIIKIPQLVFIIELLISIEELPIDLVVIKEYQKINMIKK